MSVRRVAGVGLGTAAALLAAAAAWFPPAGAALGRSADGLAGASVPVAILLGCGLLLVAVLWLAREDPPAAPDAMAAALSPPPELASGAEDRTAGTALRRQVAAAERGDPGAQAALLERVRTATIGAYARTRDCDRETARAAVAAGEWTDDRTAAAVMAPAGGPGHGLLARLRLWIDPERERRRRLRRTLSAARSLAGGERP